MMKLRLTCQQAARLITARLDRELGWFDRVVLRAHLLACKACPRFQSQVRLMDRAMDRWRAYVDQGE